jgi:hypothetical protein
MAPLAPARPYASARETAYTRRRRSFTVVLNLPRGRRHRSPRANAVWCREGTMRAPLDWLGRGGGVAPSSAFSRVLLSGPQSRRARRMAGPRLVADKRAPARRPSGQRLGKDRGYQGAQRLATGRKCEDHAMPVWPFRGSRRRTYCSHRGPPCAALGWPPRARGSGAGARGEHPHVRAVARKSTRAPGVRLSPCARLWKRSQGAAWGAV